MKKALLFLLVFILTIYPVLALECGDTITEDTIMTESLYCEGDGLTFGDENLTLDCSGHTIRGNGGMEFILTTI